jgi:hypothetical protein
MSSRRTNEEHFGRCVQVCYQVSPPLLSHRTFQILFTKLTCAIGSQSHPLWGTPTPIVEDLARCYISPPLYKDGTFPFPSIHAFQPKSLVCERTNTLSTSTSEDATIIHIKNRHAVSLTKGLWYLQYPIFHLFIKRKDIYLCLAMWRGAESLAIHFWDAVHWSDLINETVCMWAFEKACLFRFSEVSAADDLLLKQPSHKSIYV